MIDLEVTPATGIDYELITDSILHAATLQAKVAKPNTTITIVHHYEHASLHNPTIALLLTYKVRTIPELRYISTLFGIHTFLVT